VLNFVVAMLKTEEAAAQDKDCMRQKCARVAGGKN
jgi:hypothetical protein